MVDGMAHDFRNLLGVINGPAYRDGVGLAKKSTSGSFFLDFSMASSNVFPRCLDVSIR